MHQWKPAHFEAAMPYGRIGIDGLTYRGLGIECIADDGGGIWFDDWDVTHLASGRRIGTISGLDEAEAFKLATLIADLTDWGALASPDNVADVAPDLLTRLLILSDLADGAFLVTGVFQGQGGANVRTVRKVPAATSD